jgi:hypothetical protein
MGDGKILIRKPPRGCNPDLSGPAIVATLILLLFRKSSGVRDV